ncbi:MIT domain-containing protein 1 [Teleopsis dalmanni]|uniref:MIT domain-containing protein 1 n=1 Tax=Teleopsis dalmanni TaxID=139649 RepID=UPI0018CCB720|nr:MIT domain-containing protein 1 [Teleopsis dalmanni]
MDNNPVHVRQLFSNFDKLFLNSCSCFIVCKRTKWLDALIGVKKRFISCLRFSTKTSTKMENVTIILQNAFKCDEENRNMEAEMYYTKAIQIVMEMVRAFDDEKKKKFLQKIKEYIEQAEKVRTRIDTLRRCGNHVTEVHIEDDATGYSYDVLFGTYLNAGVKEILIEESYLREKHQLKNLVRFFELSIKSCPNCRYVRVVTTVDPNTKSEQAAILDEIKTNLANRNVHLNIVYDNIHDRRIVLSNGYIIISGRGLDIYKKNEGNFGLGVCDYFYRKCKRTDITIMRSSGFT